MNSIAIYVEGGGETAQQKAELRRGFDAFLATLKDAARAKWMGWKLVCCGGRNQAFDAFANAVRTSVNQVNVLLVDSEETIAGGVQTPHRIAHLMNRDGWNFEHLPADNVHLMVQCMEAWLVADPGALADFYGNGFHQNSLPRRQNLEEESKANIYTALNNASRNTQKGEYGKIRHASRLLALLDTNKVKARCASCVALFDWLSARIAQA